MIFNSEKRIPSLHFVTQNMAMGRRPWEQAELACRGGATWVSLRTKGMSYTQLLPTAFQTKEVCDHFGAIFIVNDNLLLAKEVKADGVHLGRGDVPIDQARMYLGNAAYIGVTANSFDDIKRAVELGADYIGLGPTRFTKSKAMMSPIIGPAKFLTIKRKCIQFNVDIPLIATGGVSPDDLEIFLDLGMNGIAVSSGINMSQDPVLETQGIITQLKKQIA
jgi:thiamine-phosphate pyrophosphorylase